MIPRGFSTSTLNRIISKKDTLMKKSQMTSFIKELILSMRFWPRIKVKKNKFKSYYIKRNSGIGSDTTWKWN